jgi:endonuclease YncB( thermonuclease family)
MLPMAFDDRLRDKYRQTLADVYAGDAMMHAKPVRQGYAEVAVYPPYVKYQEPYGARPAR